MSEDETPSEDEMRRQERFAEDAYDRMYDADGREVKECYEDACVALIRAMKMAEALGLMSEQERLQERLDHIMAVYTSQFRGVWR